MRNNVEKEKDSHLCCELAGWAQASHFICLSLFFFHKLKVLGLDHFDHYFQSKKLMFL